MASRSILPPFLLLGGTFRDISCAKSCGAPEAGLIGSDLWWSFWLTLSIGPQRKAEAAHPAVASDLRGGGKGRQDCQKKPGGWYTRKRRKERCSLCPAWDCWLGTHRAASACSVFNQPGFLASECLARPPKRWQGKKGWSLTVSWVVHFLTFAFDLEHDHQWEIGCIGIFWSNEFLSPVITCYFLSTSFLESPFSSNTKLTIPIKLFSKTHSSNICTICIIVSCLLAS